MTDPLTLPPKYHALALKMIWRFKSTGRKVISKVEAGNEYEPPSTNWKAKWMTHGAMAILEAMGLIVRNSNCTPRYIEYDVVV
jgi:hypothetical protein